jgi:DNA-binding GntR family transcriptional regulator
VDDRPINVTHSGSSPDGPPSVPVDRALPVSRRTVTGDVIDRLREDIRTGELAPGTRLLQLEIAARYGVSSTPVREAFSALEREGLLVSSPHRGVIVFRPTVEDLRETYEIRVALESLLIATAVPRLTDDDLDALDVIIEQMDAASDDRSQLSSLYRDFQLRISAAAGMPKLEKLVADLRDASAAYLRLYADLAPGTDTARLEQLQVVRACRARSVPNARKAAIAHLRHTVETVASGLDRELAAEAKREA